MVFSFLFHCQKAPSTRRCIKTLARDKRIPDPGSQKAPSTTRCIKTPGTVTLSDINTSVRKHPAPQGALRRMVKDTVIAAIQVRKHPAPEGALRHIPDQEFLTIVGSESTQHQKVH